MELMKRKSDLSISSSNKILECLYKAFYLHLLYFTVNKHLHFLPGPNFVQVLGGHADYLRLQSQAPAALNWGILCEKGKTINTLSKASISNSSCFKLGVSKTINT